MGCLYQLTSPSGKSYIGITSKTVAERFYQHVKHSRIGLGWGKRRGPESNMVIHRAMRKYGAESFSIKELVRANDWEYLCDLERKVIVAFDTCAPRGYNTAEGGEGATGVGFSQEARDLHKKRLSKSVTRSWKDPEIRARHMTAFTGEKFRNAIRSSMVARWKDPEFRPALEESLKKATIKLRENQHAARLEKKCAVCNGAFSVKRSRNKRKCCSFECGIKSRTRKVAVACAACAKVFYPKRGDVARGTKHCSWECRYGRTSK